MNKTEFFFCLIYKMMKMLVSSKSYRLQYLIKCYITSFSKSNCVFFTVFSNIIYKLYQIRNFLSIFFLFYPFLTLNWQEWSGWQTYNIDTCLCLTCSIQWLHFYNLKVHAAKLRDVEFDQYDQYIGLPYCNDTCITTIHCL